MSNQQEQALQEYEELLHFMAASLLDDDVDIEVRTKTRNNQWRLELLVPEQYRGRVIGRGGRIARAMRALLEQAAIANHHPVVLDIVD